jgi:methionyl-tRNA formyltransferase
VTIPVRNVMSSILNPSTVFTATQPLRLDVSASKMRLIYLGTPLFAVPTLERIVAAGHEVLSVLTQPDRPRGRGQQLAQSPVKEAALRLGLPVYQPERVRKPEAVEHLRSLGADAMVVVGYGQIIPQSVIDLVPNGIINVHASLLPKYRGAGPIQWAIVHGETRTGVTTMRIDAGLDTGDMLLKAGTEIGPDENAVELGHRLAAMGADLLVTTLDGLGTIVPEKQDNTQASYAPMLKKEDGLVDWNWPVETIHNRVRGLQPWPGAYTMFRGQRLYVWKTRIEAMGDTGRLTLVEVQLEGRKRMAAADFANGQRISENELWRELRH